MSNAATRVPRNRSTSRTVSRLCPSLKWRSVARMMRASMPLAALARATASSTITTTCSLERPRRVGTAAQSDLDVDHAVAAELRKEIVHHEAQRLLALHQGDMIRRRAQVFGQVPALRRCDESRTKASGVTSGPRRRTTS